MSTEHEDEGLERRARETFEASVAGLDSATRSRLRQARLSALETAPRGRMRLALGQRPVWASASLAAALVAAWMLWAPQHADSPEVGPPVADLDILLADEDLAMLEELEFYTWLEEQPELAAPDDGDGVG